VNVEEFYAVVSHVDENAKIWRVCKTASDAEQVRRESIWPERHGVEKVYGVLLGDDEVLVLGRASDVFRMV
jgi:hypothetical protein